MWEAEYVLRSRLFSPPARPSGLASQFAVLGIASLLSNGYSDDPAEMVTLFRKLATHSYNSSCWCRTAGSSAGSSSQAEQGKLTERDSVQQESAECSQVEVHDVGGVSHGPALLNWDHHESTVAG